MACFFVIYNRDWIFAIVSMVFFIIPVMNSGRRDFFKFGNEFFNVYAVRIKFLLLNPWIEYLKIRLTSAAGSGYPLPISIVDRGIVVYKRLSKILFAYLPIDMQIFY